MRSLLAWLAIASFFFTSINAIAQDLPLGPSLQEATPNTLPIGAVLHGYTSNWDRADLLATADREFNAITATAYMAYGAWPDPNQAPDTSGFEQVVDWAYENGKLLHGHTLVFPKANKDLPWWQSTRRRDAESKLKEFITEMVSCRAGKVWVWDVVNEVMADDGGRMDSLGLRSNVKEYKQVGSDYVDKAFAWADEADPNALLILNDYGAETINPKSDRLLNYVTELKSRGVPIDGVGFQFHFLDTTADPDFDGIRANFQRFADAGFRIFITEMDVSATRSADGTAPTKEELERQARIYNELTQIAVEQPACESLLLWDFVDEDSWLNPSILDSEYLSIGEYSFPTPFSGGITNLIDAKPAYYGIQAGLQLLDSIGGPPNEPDGNPGDGMDDSSDDSPNDNGSDNDPGPVDPPVDPLSLNGLDVNIVSLLQGSDGFLTRDGLTDGENVSTPQNLTYLSDGSGSNDPAESVWVFEHVSEDIYRIRSQWGGLQSYLTLSGIQDKSGSWNPSSELFLADLEEEWQSQKWIVKEVLPGEFTIQNQWSKAAGFLTRDVVITKRGKKNTTTRPADTVSAQSETSQSADSQSWQINIIE